MLLIAHYEVTDFTKWQAAFMADDESRRGVDHPLKRPARR